MKKRSQVIIGATGCAFSYVCALLLAGHPAWMNVFLCAFCSFTVFLLFLGCTALFGLPDVQDLARAKFRQFKDLFGKPKPSKARTGFKETSARVVRATLSTLGSMLAAALEGGIVFAIGAVLIGFGLKLAGQPVTKVGIGMSALCGFVIGIFYGSWKWGEANSRK